MPEETDIAPIDNQRTLVTELISHYEPNAEVNDDYYSGLLSKYGNTDTLITKLINHYEPQAEVGIEYLNGLYNKYGVKKKDIPGATTTTVSEVSESETPSTSQEVFDTFFKVTPSKVEETTIEETEEEVTPEPEEQQVTVDTQGEMSFRLPTPEEEKGLVKKAPGEERYEKQVLADAPTMYSYGENELYNQEQIGEMKKISQEAIDETLPTEAPKDKDYTATFEQLREKLTKQHPDNPAYIDSEIGGVQSNILTTDVIESFSKLHPQYQEEFITMGGMDMENFKRGYRDLGFDDDVVDRVVSSVVEGQKDDMLIRKQVDVFKEDHPEFDDDKLNKFIYKNAVSDAYSMMNEDEIKASKVNAELQLLLEEDEPDYNKIMDLRNQLDKSREGQFYDSFTGLRINTEELAEDKEYEEQVIAVAREIKKQPNLMEKLGEGMSESYLVHKRLHDLYLREAAKLREGYDPGAVGQRRQYGDTEYDKQKDKVDNLYRQQNQARIEQDAWARMFLLNEDPGEAEKGLKHYGEMIGKSFIGSLFGEQAGSNAFSPTQRERFDVMEQVLSGKDIELTQKQKENLKRDFSEDALEMGGGLGGVVIQFAGLNKAGAALKIPEMIKLLRGGGKLSNTVATVMEASIEGVKFQMIGGAPGAGEAFYATQRLLPDIKVGGKWKHILTPIVNVLYKADIGMTTASNVSATIEAGIKALEQDREFKNVMKEQFGDLSNFQHHVLTELSVNWMFGLAHLKNPTAVAKKANELSDRAGKVIEEFKADPRRTKAEIGEIEKLKNRLDLETGVLEKGEAIDLRDPKSEYTISGEGFKAEGEQVTEQKLMQNLRKPEFVEKVKAGTINMELRNVTPKLKDKVERILGETEGVVIKEAKVAEKAPETEIETLDRETEVARIELHELRSEGKAEEADKLESEIFKDETKLRDLVEVEEDAKRIVSLEAKAPKDLIGEQADYGGIKGEIAKDSEGNMVIETVEGEQHIIEGGRSGKTAKELGIEITEARSLPIEKINEIVEPIPDTEIQVKASFDGKANTVRLYGNEYTYEKLNLDENGNAVSLQVTDAKGNTKTIKNQDALIEIEIQKEAWDLKQTGEISVKEITTEAEKQNLKEDESKIKDEQRRKRDTEQVLPERPTEDTKRVEPEKKPREEPTEVAKPPEAEEKITKTEAETEVITPMQNRGNKIQLVGSVETKGESKNDIDIVLSLDSDIAKGEAEFTKFEKDLTEEGWKWRYSDENAAGDIFHNYEKYVNGRLVGLDVFLEYSKKKVSRAEEEVEKPPEAEKPVEAKEEVAEKPVEEAKIEFKEHITTGTKEQAGKYEVRKEGEEIKIFNADSGKEVKLTKQNKWAVDQYVEANLKALRSGEKAKLPEGVLEGDINRLIAEESSNPEEIASAWIFSKELKDPSEMTFEEAVYESAWNIDPESFRKTVGYGTKDVPHLLNRFKKGGEGFDSIAERVEETMNMAKEQTGAIVEGQKTKEGETVQRIIDVLTSKDFKNYKPKQETQDQIDLSTKFKELTGLNLTEAIAEKVTDHRSKMEKFADALDKKADEFDFPAAPFFLAPRLVKIAMKSVAAAIRQGIKIERAINLALNEVKRVKEKYEKFNGKEFRQFVKEQMGEPFAKVKIPKGTQVKTAIEKEVGIKKEEVVETLTTRQYYKFIEKIGKQYVKFAEKETRLGIKETKKATSLMQEELVSFVKTNMKDLQRVSGRSVPALMKKIANVRAGKPKALKDAIDYIEKIASGQAEKDRLAAIEGVRNTVETAMSKATRKASSGGLTARAFTGEGKKSIETLKKSFDMTEQEASDRGTHIEAEINSLGGERIEDITDAKRNEIDDKIFELQKEAEYVELYSDLNNKSKEEIDGIHELLKGEIASLKEDLKGKRKERSEKFKNKKEVLVKGIGEAIWEKEPEKPGVGAAYLAKQLNPKNLLTQLAGKAGEPFGKAFDVGIEKAVSTETKMKKSVKKSVNEFFDSEMAMRKVLNKEVKINLVKETKDAEGNVIETSLEPRKVKVSSLAHLWASYKSESNHIYTQRIASGKERLKLSPEEWLRIDGLLPSNVKNFTDWIVKDFLPEHYEQANKVYYERNFINLTKLPDYLFVNAERVRDANAALTDINRLSTYKPFTTQRVYGEYNLWGNDIYSGLMKHIDQHSKFVGLSKPISEVNALLNSKDVSRLIKQKGLQPYKSSLEHMMTVGMAGDKRYFLPDLLFGNFVGSKVLMNLSLFPKQMTSFITVLDPQYTSTGELMRSIGRISTNKQARKRAINILEGSGLFSTRNIKEIETHIKKGNPNKAELLIEKIANKMEDKRLAKSIKTVGEFIWNPTQKGDRFTIRLGGIPLIDAVYRTKLNRLIKDGVGKEEAKIMATNEALYKFNEWMGDTQQSMQWTGKSEFQTGTFRYLAPFMNAPMSYSRKVITSYRDVYRGMKAERSKLLKENPTMNPHVATIKSLKGVKGADLQRIALYQMALPVLWSAVTTAGRSVVNLWSDDEKKRKQAWMDLGYDTTLAWTKGLYGIGFVMDYVYGYATDRKYGRQADNLFRLADDGMNMLTSLIDVFKKSVELSKDLTDEEYEKQEKKVVKAYTKAGVNLTAVLGLPQMAAKRTQDVVTNDLYNTPWKKIARLYGMRKESIKEWFEFEIEPEKFEAKEQYLNRMQKGKDEEFTEDEIYEAKRTYDVYKTNNEQIIYFYKNLYPKNDNTKKANYLMDIYGNTKNHKTFHELNALGLISESLGMLYNERIKKKKKK